MKKIIPALVFLIMVLLAIFSWDLHRSTIDQGEQLAMEDCSGCHDLTEQKINGKGPYLWGVVNRRAASVADFTYSEAFLAFAGSRNFSWTGANLDTFIVDPNRLIPGTAMTQAGGDSAHVMAFANMNQLDQRRQLISYLRTLK